MKIRTSFNAIFRISLFAWPFLWYGSYFMFDAPSSMGPGYQWVVFYAIHWYPAVVAISLIGRFLATKLSKLKLASIFRYLPFINITIVGIPLAVMIIVTPFYMIGEMVGPFLPQVYRFKCPDRRALVIEDGKAVVLEQHTLTMTTKSYIGKIENNKFNFTATDRENELFRRDKNGFEYICNCRNRKGKSIVDLYGFTRESVGEGK